MSRKFFCQNFHLARGGIFLYNISTLCKKNRVLPQQKKSKLLENLCASITVLIIIGFQDRAEKIWCFEGQFDYDKDYPTFLLSEIASDAVMKYLKSDYKADDVVNYFTKDYLNGKFKSYQEAYSSIVDYYVICYKDGVKYDLHFLDGDDVPDEEEITDEALESFEPEIFYSNYTDDELTDEQLKEEVDNLIELEYLPLHGTHTSEEIKANFSN